MLFPSEASPAWRRRLSASLRALSLLPKFNPFDKQDARVVKKIFSKARDRGLDFRYHRHLSVPLVLFSRAGENANRFTARYPRVEHFLMHGFEVMRILNELFYGLLNDLIYEIRNALLDSIRFSSSARCCAHCICNFLVSNLVRFSRLLWLLLGAESGSRVSTFAAPCDHMHRPHIFPCSRFNYIPRLRAEYNQLACAKLVTAKLSTPEHRR